MKTPIRQPNSTREQLRTAIGSWIERTHHRRCRQVGLGRLTPIEFEATYDHTGRSGPRNRICYLVVRQTQTLTRPVDFVRAVVAAGHSRTDGVELRLLQSWGNGRTPSWLTTIWAA